MDRRKIIKITITVLGVILVATLLEIGIRFIATKIDEANEAKIIQEQEEKKYNSYDETIKRNMQQFVADIVGAINDKDYTYVFYYLDSIYKSYMFDDDIEKMKTYIDKEFNNLDNYEIIKISADGFLHNIILGISTESGYETKTLSIRSKDKETFALMFGDFSSLNNEKAKVVTNDFEYSINYSYSVSEFLVYVLDIKNKTSETMDFSFNSTSMVYTSGTSKSGSVPDKFQINNGETKRLELVFPKTKLAESFVRLDFKLNDTNEIIEIHFDNTNM